MSTAVAAGNGTGNATQRNLGEELNLEINEEEKTKGGETNVQQNGAKTAGEVRADQKTESKKQKVTVEMNPTDLKEIDILITLGVYESRDQFIVEAVNEKKAAVMDKLKAAAKKK